MKVRKAQSGVLELSVLLSPRRRAREGLVLGVHEVLEVERDISVAGELGVVLDNQPLLSGDVRVDVALIKRCCTKTSVD